MLMGRSKKDEKKDYIEIDLAQIGGGADDTQRYS